MSGPGTLFQLAVRLETLQNVEEGVKDAFLRAAHVSRLEDRAKQVLPQSNVGGL
jgi:hypothetical protein